MKMSYLISCVLAPALNSHNQPQFSLFPALLINKRCFLYGWLPHWRKSILWQMPIMDALWAISWVSSAPLLQPLLAICFRWQTWYVCLHHLSPSGTRSRWRVWMFHSFNNMEFVRGRKSICLGQFCECMCQWCDVCVCVCVWMLLCT